MNNTIQNIMLFINEHTLLLIGICVFLILVLIGYLIDNSVKSKRIRKDIKNADQVPENIKDEIIKQAEEKNIIKNENVNEQQKTLETPSVQTEQPIEQENVDIPLDLNSTNIQSENVIDPNEQNTGIINSNVNENSDFQFNNFANENQVSNEPLNLDTQSEPQQNLQTDIEPIQIDAQINQEPQINDVLNLDISNTNDTYDQTKDPDYNIMMNSNEVSNYKNDKKLSEILSSIDNINTQNDIFNADNNIVINNEVSKNDVQIENANSSDELDRIMRKLSSMNNEVQDDSYTNIF